MLVEMHLTKLSHPINYATGNNKLLRAEGGKNAAIVGLRGSVRSPKANEKNCLFLFVGLS